MYFSQYSKEKRKFEMDTLEQTIADIRGRNIALSIRDEKIVASLPLMAHEKEILKENRERAIAIIAAAPEATAAPEALPTACDCTHHREGYALGIAHAIEEMASRAPVAAPVAPTAPPMTVDEVMEGFVKWQKAHGDYYVWEIECNESLREALRDGDRVRGLFAYTAIVVRADGREEEFQRRPSRKK
jgi:hypothetical protein